MLFRHSFLLLPFGCKLEKAGKSTNALVHEANAKSSSDQQPPDAERRLRRGFSLLERAYSVRVFSSKKRAEKRHKGESVDSHVSQGHKLAMRCNLSRGPVKSKKKHHMFSTNGSK